MIIFYELDFVRTTMKTSFIVHILLMILIISGCSLFQPEETKIIQPKLLKQSSLPPIKATNYSDSFEFTCEMLIDEKGNVEKARLLTKSGDALWDSLATLSLYEWKFSPAIANGVPVKQLIRRRIKVVFEQPEILPLAEIQISSFELADSVYKALQQGANFKQMVAKYSVSPTKINGGYLGNVDIKQYSKEIGRVLRKLKPGDFSEPLAFGDRYVIFKRIDENN